MKILLPLVCFLYLSTAALSQVKSEEKDSIVVGNSGEDKLYREDQLYVGFSFNLLLNRPKGATQSGFSGGLHLGFIRDFPINKKRTFALGAGLGWSANSYGLNLLINKNNEGQTTFKVLDGVYYQTNRYTMYMVEAPLQFRWRNSTPSTYKFWRIYTGFRLGYLYHFRAKYEDENTKITHTDVDGLNRFRIGATFTFGFNTFNFHVYYSLNPFFDAKTVNQRQVGLNTIKVGLMFYIL